MTSKTCSGNLKTKHYEDPKVSLRLMEGEGHAVVIQTRGVHDYRRTKINRFGKSNNYK
jgi:hypothetical protein